MKVLWIIPGDPASKVNMIFAKRSLPFLTLSEVEVEIFYLRSRSNPLVIFKCLLEARKIIKTFNPQMIHAQYGTVTAFFTMFLGLPYLITFRGSDINGDPNISALRRFFSFAMSQIAGTFADARIFVSEILKFKLVLPPTGNFNLSSPIDLEKFKPHSKSESRRTLGISQDEKVIAFVSSGERGLKRPELARAVAEYLCKVKKLKIRFLEIQGITPEEVPVWLSASDCLLFTSLREGSPNAVREALACGIPVISVEVGDVGKWIAMDKASRLVKEDSVECLGKAVLEVLSKNYENIRRANLSEFTPRAHAEKLKRIYEKVLSHEI